MNIAPVLFIVFNRLSTAQKTFEAIREAKPAQLFVAADGPRKDHVGEAQKCLDVREWVLKHVDWDCRVETLFQSDNLGCGKGPATAISWFFTHVESGIIIEDDCVPHQDFFRYCTELLIKYAGRADVYAINSSNFQKNKIKDGSYYFSMQNGPFCAWATWKRAWADFDFGMNRYDRSKIELAMKWYYRTTVRERKWWMDIYNNLVEGFYNDSSWDYQFIFAIWANNGKSIVPNANLSTNIGFGPEATHTTNSNAVTANRPLEPLYPLRYPKKEKINRKADLYYHDFYYDKFVEHVTLFKYIKRKIKRLLLKK